MFEARSKLPDQRLFGPTHGLDHRLFNGERLKPDVRRYVLSTLGSFWAPRYGSNWATWARVYLAGSEASEWTSASLEGNNDFDVLVGVAYDPFRRDVPALAHLSDEEISARMNAEFRAGLMPHTDPVWIPVRVADGDMKRSSSWLPHSSSPLTSSNSSSPTTRTAPPPARSRRSTTSTSPRSVGTSTWPASNETCGDARLGPSARSAASVTSPPSRRRTEPAGHARPTTSETDICGSTTASQPSDSMKSLLSRMGLVASAAAVKTTGSSAGPLTTTTGAAPASAPAGSASEASSASAAISPSGTSAKPIFAPLSSGWTAASPPPAPEGWEFIGPFDQTFYCNPDSYDIREIKPYAAYDVTADAWAVKPPHLPSWSIEDFPQGHSLVQECQGYAAVTRAILRMPEPYRAQQADALWRHLHGDRSRAFGPNGEGWYDSGNVIEKFMDQLGLWEPLAEAHFEVVANPAKLQAPTTWSNDPRVTA